MNSGRTKYTSTPTYGLQKKGFGKRQTENNPEVDFTQKPTPDFNAPVLGANDPFAMPQGIPNAPMPQQSNMPYQAYPPQGQTMGAMPLPVQNQGMQGNYPVNGPGYSVPYTGTPLPQMPPLANAAAPPNTQSGNGRTQGYVPPSVMRAEQAPVPGWQPNAMPQPVPFQQAQQPMYSMQQPGNPPTGPNGGYQAFGGGNPPPEQPTGKRNKPPFNIDNWLKMLLYIILPLLFVLCIALRDEGFNILRYLFITASAASVGMLWYRKSFSASLRTGVTIGYGLMCIVMLVIMLSGSNNDVINNKANITAQPTLTVTEEPSAESLGYQPDQAPETTPPVEVEPKDTEEGLRLAAFMDNWAQNNIEGMLSYVSPSWRASQTDAATSLFSTLFNRTPLNYEIEKISGTSGDTSRSITMSASIDKNNGNDPVRYRFIILMDKEDGNWYVDPNTLSTNDADPTDTPLPDNIAAVYTEQPRTTVTPVPPDSMPLYYNADGGKYYHADPSCSSVNEKYLPMSSFTYGELNDSPYKSLRPCLVCNAPTK